MAVPVKCVLGWLLCWEMWRSGIQSSDGIVQLNKRPYIMAVRDEARFVAVLLCLLRLFRSSGPTRDTIGPCCVPPVRRAPDNFSTIISLIGTRRRTESRIFQNSDRSANIGSFKMFLKVNLVGL